MIKNNLKDKRNEELGSDMSQSEIETRLVRKNLTYPLVCTYCQNAMPDDTYYLEEGVNDHIHSLIARKYCSTCYTKYGERILLSGKK